MVHASSDGAQRRSFASSEDGLSSATTIPHTASCLRSNSGTTCFEQWVLSPSVAKCANRHIGFRRDVKDFTRAHCYRERQSIGRRISGASRMGLRGKTGIKGQRGRRGPKGASGVIGGRGEAGNPGPQGIKGMTGATGLKGLRGLIGKSGHQGEIGLPGRVGRKGLRGLIGKPGHKGLKGLTGPLRQDDCLERIVHYFDDVHAELLEQHGELAQLTKKVDRLTAESEVRARRD